MNTNKLLYIGLNGFAGSGKDTVAKMLRTILSKDWNNIEECKEYYKQVYWNPTISATFKTNEQNSKVLCIAFADQLKNICSSIFGIPVERFYQNKSTAWICINKDFKYTEIKPNADDIVTAEEYFNYKHSNPVWMSLRDILVYIGTYVLQEDINKQVFVNIVRNTIRENYSKNNNLKYVIVTDVRFNHEIEYIREYNGITMTITRNNVQQLDNIAEHDLDDEEDYDYVIENNGTYDELFEQVWNIVHENIEFENNTISLFTRDDVSNFLRLIETTDSHKIFKLCSPYRIQKLYRSEGEITMVDLVGGPTIYIGESIPGTSYTNNDITGLIPYKIELSEISQQFLIYTYNN